VTIATVARTGLSIAPNFGSENLLKWLVETCDRPRRCAAEQRDERTAVHDFLVHSITSSARPISGSGTEMPSAFAVYCSSSTSVSCVHHETSCWPPSMSYVAPVSAVLLMM